MGTDYKQFLRDIAPPWLLDKWGDAWLRAFADVKDGLLERTKDAVRARFAFLAPEDGLAEIGAERQLPRAPGEASDTYAARLVGAWNAWPWAGTAKGVLNALWDAGYSNYPSIYIAKGKIYQLDASRNLTIGTGPFLEFGPTPGFWSAFVLYFATLPPQWSGTPPLSTSDEAKFIMSEVKKWKAAHARFDAVVIQQTGYLWGIGTWGAPRTWGGTSVIWTPP